MKLIQGHVPTIDVNVGPIRARAVIDTGSQVTSGNLALRDALLERRRLEERAEEIIGVTGDSQEGPSSRVPPIVLGDVLIRNAHIMFVDLHIFKHWKLTDEPAILIGMDVLGVLDTLILDYRRREMQISLVRLIARHPQRACSTPGTNARSGWPLRDRARAARTAGRSAMRASQAESRGVCARVHHLGRQLAQRIDERVGVDVGDRIVRPREPGPLRERRFQPSDRQRETCPQRAERRIVVVAVDHREPRGTALNRLDCRELRAQAQHVAAARARGAR